MDSSHQSFKGLILRKHHFGFLISRRHFFGYFLFKNLNLAIATRTCCTLLYDEGLEPLFESLVDEA